MKGIFIVLLTALAVNVLCFGIEGKASQLDSLPSGSGGQGAESSDGASEALELLHSGSKIRYRRSSGSYFPKEVASAACKKAVCGETYFGVVEKGQPEYEAYCDCMCIAREALKALGLGFLWVGEDC